MFYSSLRVNIADMLGECQVLCPAPAISSMCASPAVQYSISMKQKTTDVIQAELWMGKQMHCCQSQNTSRSTGWSEAAGCRHESQSLVKGPEAQPAWQYPQLQSTRHQMDR